MVGWRAASDSDAGLDYSDRNVSAGFNRRILLDGITLAIAVAASKPKETSASVVGSLGRTPYRKLFNNRSNANDAAAPINTPANTHVNPGRSAVQTASFADDPSARRMPSSLLRSATRFAMRP